MASDQQPEPQLAAVRLSRGEGGDIATSAPESIPVSEGYRIGLSARDARWLLGIPEPPRKTPTPDQRLAYCERMGCAFTEALVAGWEFCSVHGTTRKAVAHGE